MRFLSALPGFAACLAFAMLSFPAAPLAQVRPPAGPIPDVDAASLPAQAQTTLISIRNGGPFPYERDGIRFGNREWLLPQKARNYYREYTVRTPGVRTRGARRIVCGGPRTTPDVCYYTADHYQSFARIRE